VAFLSHHREVLPDAAIADRTAYVVIKPGNFINRSRSTDLDEGHGIAQCLFPSPPPSIIPDPDGVHAGSIFRQQGPGCPLGMLGHKPNNNGVVFSKKFTEFQIQIGVTAEPESQCSLRHTIAIRLLAPAKKPWFLARSFSCVKRSVKHAVRVFTVAVARWST
jgi:hypothetical protein